ncbi:hypothetical protein IKZ40_00560 [bacterium]|nr:hypothetical protein [bacterium]
MSSDNWKPKYPGRKDREIELINYKFQFDHNGVYISEESKHPESPAFFWIDEEHVYIRINWATWAQITGARPERLEEICRSDFSKVVRQYENDSTILTCPVYHIAKLPEELFDM